MNTDFIYVFCNGNMIGILPPIEKSRGLSYYPETVYTAKYDLAKLESIAESQCINNNAWWREIGRLNIQYNHKPRIMRKTGIFNYLCNVYGISTEKNVALAIGEICNEENKTPIELFNTL